MSCSESCRCPKCMVQPDNDPTTIAVDRLGWKLAQRRIPELEARIKFLEAVAEQATDQLEYRYGQVESDERFITKTHFQVPELAEYIAKRDDLQAQHEKK